MRRSPAILIVILFALANAPLDAQRGRRRGEPIPSWSIEPIMRASIIKDDAVTLAGGRVARQMDSTLNLGVAGATMLTGSAETQRVDGFERITSMLYLGPSIELRDSLRGPSRFIVRATGLVGLAGFEEQTNDVINDGSTFFGGVEADVGILVRLTRALQISATAGVLYGWRVDGGPAIISGPSAAFGIRFVR
ncbi:MAG: hypothetical protein H7X80_07380 [bacterium]|nr:hypothetical protein [Candidatus Kapabacteria bacterium]